MKSIRNLAGDGTTQEKFMGKPSGKQSKRNKNNGAQDKKSKTEKPVAAKVAKPVKEKGPRPASYEPNEKRRQEQSRLELAHKVNEAKTLFPALAIGVHGVYMVGYNLADYTEAHMFTVKEITLPAKDNKPEKKFLAIQEADDRCQGVFIPHEWLFHPASDRFYANGPVGHIQREMLQYLQRNLCVEISAIKKKRWEERQAAERAKAAEGRAKALAERSTQIAGSENVVPIQDAILTRDCRPLRDLRGQGKEGLYSLPDDKGQLIVQFVRQGTGNCLIVKKVTPGHHLNDKLMQGFVVQIATIKNDCPELDQHIRKLLEAEGVRHGMKSRHDKRALVTEGLPNVIEETRLAA